MAEATRVGPPQRAQGGAGRQLAARERHEECSTEHRGNGGNSEQMTSPRGQASGQSRNTNQDCSHMNGRLGPQSGSQSSRESNH